MKSSEEGVKCKHCEVVGIEKPATNKVEFFGEEIFLCHECLDFAISEGLINEETYGIKKKKNRRGVVNFD